MPVINQQNESESRSNIKVPSTLIGEQEQEACYCEPCPTTKIGEASDNDESESEPQPQSSFTDKYFQIIMHNIGSYTSYNTLYAKNDIIGVGSESIVYQGTTLSTSNAVAIQETFFTTKSQLICWFSKYLIIKQCNFYTLYDAFYAPTTDGSYKIILVLDLFEQNITEIMTENALNHENMSEQDIKKMTFQIVSQLQILTETYNYMHCDIKPTNVMQNSHGDYSLIDFGYSLECGTIFNGYLGTKEWSAPEIKPYENMQNELHKSADMWSIALIILYCLYNGRHPFCSKKNRKNSLRDIQKWYKRKVEHKQCFIEAWLGKQLVANKISYYLFDFLFKCLRFDPSKRLTAKQAIAHKWLQTAIIN